MTTQYYTAASIDGFIADKNNSLDWLLQFDDTGGSEPSDADYAGFIGDVGALAMGATTYDWILDHHVRPPDGEPSPWPYAQPTWVFSHRELPSIDGADIRFVSAVDAPGRSVTAIHDQMVEAAAGKNVWLVGGGDLVGQFADVGLLDEIILTIAPVTLGGGSPVLPRELVTPPLQLTSLRQSGPFAQLRYTVQTG
jgi:dihydrofolate reductase